MRTFQLGTELPAGEFLLKKNSVMTFDIFFWEDAANTIPSDLTGAVISLQVTDAAGALTTFNAVNNSNRAVWTLTSAQTNVNWNRATFQVVMTKSGDRTTLVSGTVKVQE